MDEIVWALGLGGFAGAINYLQRFASDAASRPPWEWMPFLVKFCTGAFVGILTLWVIGKRLEADHVRVAIAIAGYGGPLTLDFAWKLGSDVASFLVTRAAQRSQNDPPKG